MPCSDSSSSITINLDPQERFLSFDFAKITCGREITAQTGYSAYCVGKTPCEILGQSYRQTAEDLELADEEAQFILYLEWDALRSALAEYLGTEHADIDQERCRITSISHHERGIEIALVILPPRTLPKIIPCGLAQRN